MSRIALCSWVLTCLLAGSALAGEIRIPHMGRLIVNDGARDVAVNGARKLKFSIYTSSVSASGQDTLLWEETYSDVAVHDGVYAIDLGDPSGGKAPLLVDDLIAAPELWLEVTVYENSAAAGVKLAPRMRLAQALTAAKADDSRRLGGVEAAEYLRRGELESGAVKVAWSNIDGIPAAFADGADDGLDSVTTSGSALQGRGTGTDPLRVANGGVGTAHLADASVTAQKLAPGALTPNSFQDGSFPPAKLAACAEGQILKFQSGTWQCGVDTGSGGTLSFDVIAPLQQIAGDGSTPAKLSVLDGGINTVKLANASVNSAKLAGDWNSLAKLSLNALTTAPTGSVGVGASTPTARLEVSEFPSGGVAGTGTVTSSAGVGSATVSNGSFSSLRAGDAIQLGNQGWRTITGVSGSTVTFAPAYTNGYSGNWSYRFATLRSGELTGSALGGVGIGTQAPAADTQLDVNGVLGVGRSRWGSDQGGQLELGASNDTANPVSGGTPYIDFHYGTNTAEDFNTRISNDANNQLSFHTKTGRPLRLKDDSVYTLAVKQVNNNAKTTYEVNHRRYHIEATKAVVRNTVPIDHAILSDLCRDDDGCSITLGMRNWASGAAATAGSVASHGPFRFFMSQTSNVWRRSNGGTDARDGDGAVSHVLQDWDCFFTDGQYVNGAANDSSVGFGLLNWNAQYNDPNMVCTLTIED